MRKRLGNNPLNSESRKNSNDNTYLNALFQKHEKSVNETFLYALGLLKDETT